ncbi:MAG: hypothetical protein RIR26_2735 [Pseudomonadota bacterium]|jgi:catechol 2,3-dioxygenase-like lactoylglutathione lyase family enzyme
METRVHVSLEVSNLEKSVTFYSKLFQSAPTKIQTDYANFRMEEPPLHLALVLNPDTAQESNSNRHYGIELFEDARLNSWLQSAKSANLPLRIEENVTCCYAVANKFWVRDPDGHEWEFWVRSAEADTMHGVETNTFKSEKSQCCAPSPALKTEQNIAPSCCAPNQCG